MAAINPRDLVCIRLTAQIRRFPQLELAPLDTSALEERDERDAALAHAIDQAVMRRWLTLEAVIQSRLMRPWDSVQPSVRAALLAGAAQLLLLERLPDHAVINEAVRWAREQAGAGAGGLVNAVLRKVAMLRLEIVAADAMASGQAPPAPSGPFPRDYLPLHDGRAWRLAEPVFADDSAHRVAQQTSHAEALIKRWTNLFGRESATELALHSLVQGPILVSGLSPEAAAEACSSAPPLLSAHDEPGFFVFAGRRSELVALLDRSPPARVQDPGTALAVAATASLRPRLIVDVCAGQGTKTRQLTQLHPQARILATDVDESRRAALRNTFAGHDRVTVIDPAELRQYDAQADLLVFDVPCSNTGVLARRPEAKYRYSQDSIQSLVDLQRQIIADSIPLLARPGHLLYATCSIDETENDRQAKWAMKWHRLEMVVERLRLPRGRPGDEPRGYSDGGYFALLKNA